MRTEAPTLLVAAAIYAGWGCLTFFHEALPIWALVPVAGLLLAWHGSLQHEAVHGHPTSSRLINSLIAGVPLSLWLPLPLYRVSHLEHHRSDLTDPIEDPESYYVTAEAWGRMNPLARALGVAMNTMAGRLLLGPAVMVTRLYLSERGRYRRHARIWLTHAGACALVLAWVIGVCGMPWWLYLIAFVYPGLSVTLMRSYLEHRPDPEGARRSVVVEAGPLFSLVFLNNNLHAVHHRMPGLPWYRLPARWRELREEILAENGGYRFDGYHAIARRFGFVPKDSPVHPRGAG